MNDFGLIGLYDRFSVSRKGDSRKSAKLSIDVSPRFISDKERSYLYLTFVLIELVTVNSGTFPITVFAFFNGLSFRGQIF